MLVFYIIIFLASCFFLVLSSKFLVDAVSRIALFLRMKEFVVAFFFIAFGASLPNLFVGIMSALNKIPELSFGDVVSGNILDLSLGIGLPALISLGGLTAESRTLQGSALFVMIIAVLPLLLILDGDLSRIDGILLILSFIFYISWVFSKKERFSKIYNHNKEALTSKKFIKDLFLLIFCLVLLLISAKGVVDSATYFYQTFHLPLALIGILIVGIGNSLPETFFSLRAAKRGQDWALLGNLMGGVSITATLVLGLVSLICPIKITNFSPFFIARIFLVISALFFFISVKTGRKITKKEGLVLVLIYVLFLITEIFFAK